MKPDEGKSTNTESSKLNDMQSCTSEVYRLQKQLETERKAAANKERILNQSLQESNQMSAHLQQVNGKERKKPIPR